MRLALPPFGDLVYRCAAALCRVARPRAYPAPPPQSRSPQKPSPLHPHGHPLLHLHPSRPAARRHRLAPPSPPSLQAAGGVVLERPIWMDQTGVLVNGVAGVLASVASSATEAARKLVKKANQRERARQWHRELAARGRPSRPYRLHAWRRLSDWTRGHRRAVTARGRSSTHCAAARPRLGLTALLHGRAWGLATPKAWAACAPPAATSGSLSWVPRELLGSPMRAKRAPHSLSGAPSWLMRSRKTADARGVGSQAQPGNACRCTIMPMLCANGSPRNVRS